MTMIKIRLSGAKVDGSIVVDVNSLLVFLGKAERQYRKEMKLVQANTIQSVISGLEDWQEGMRGIV
jgi:hypothetical protein